MLQVSLKHGGCDPLLGLPFGLNSRQPHRGSLGHAHHGKTMFSGVSTPNSTSFFDFFDSNICNIQLEAWSNNAFKSNNKYEEIKDEMDRIMRSGVEKGLIGEEGFNRYAERWASQGEFTVG